MTRLEGISKDNFIYETWFDRWCFEKFARKHGKKIKILEIGRERIERDFEKILKIDPFDWLLFTRLDLKSKKIKILSLSLSLCHIFHYVELKKKKKGFLIKIPFFTSEIVPYMELRSILREMNEQHDDDARFNSIMNMEWQMYTRWFDTREKERFHRSWFFSSLTCFLVWNFTRRRT